MIVFYRCFYADAHLVPVFKYLESTLQLDQNFGGSGDGKRIKLKVGISVFLLKIMHFFYYVLWFQIKLAKIMCRKTPQNRIKNFGMGGTRHLFAKR